MTEWDSPQNRLSKACENVASQLGLIVRMTSAFDEAKAADLIYQYMREYLHNEEDIARTP